MANDIFTLNVERWLFQDADSDLMMLPPLNCTGECPGLPAVPMPEFGFTAVGKELMTKFNDLWESYLENAKPYTLQIMELIDDGKDDEADKIRVPGILTNEDYNRYVSIIRETLSLPSNFPVIPTARLSPIDVKLEGNEFPIISEYSGALFLREDLAKVIQSKNWKGTHLYQVPIANYSHVMPQYYEIFSSFIGDVDTSLKLLANITRCPDCGLNTQRNLPEGISKDAIVPKGPLFHLEDYEGIYVTEEFQELVMTCDPSVVFCRLGA